jgi:hypothetical protein
MRTVVLVDVVIKICFIMVVLFCGCGHETPTAGAVPLLFTQLSQRLPKTRAQRAWRRVRAYPKDHPHHRCEI